jgi:23S rRNA (cytosine1962-C5)-methyltransferase
MEVMSSKPLFFVFSCHTPGFSPLICEHLLKQILFSKKGKITSKEMFIPSKTSFSLPLGSCSIWER